MEDAPLQPNPRESSSDDKDKKRKSRKRKFVAPIPVEPVEKVAEALAKPERNAFDEMLAKLAVERHEQAEASEPAEAEAADEESGDGNPIGDEEHEAYQPLPEHDLEPTEFNGGEVIIRLQGDEPVAERVVPFEDTIAASPATPEPARQPLSLQPPIERSVEPLPTPEPLMPRFETMQQPIYPEPTALDTYPPVAAAMETVPAAVVEPATKQDLEDALYRATRTGEHRGALSGLMVGGAYEHFKHKHREKQTKKRFHEQAKQQTATREIEHFAFAEQAQRNAEQSRRLTTVEQRLEMAAQPEKLPVKAAEAKLAEVPGQELAIPAGHRLETSAWHTIEVDAKTGRPAETPAFTYGHEYYRERAAENTPAYQRNAAAGEVALVAAAVAGQGGASDTPNIPPIPDASTQGAPPKHPKQASADQTSRGKSSAGHTAASDDTQPLWPWVVTLIVIVVVLVLLLH